MNTFLTNDPVRFLSGDVSKADGHGAKHGTDSEANKGHVECDACCNPMKHEEHHTIPIASQVLFSIMVALIIG